MKFGMTRFAALFALVICGLIAAPVAVASSPGKVSGNAQEAGGRHVMMIAQGSPTEARGHFSQISPVAHPRGEVHCLNVQGNRAAASGVLDEPVFGFTHFIVLFEDNNPRPSDQFEAPNRRAANHLPDRWLTFLAQDSELTSDCGWYLFSDGSWDAFHYTVIKGNIIVRDR